MYEDLYKQNKEALHAIAWKYRDLCEKDRAVSVEDLTQAAFIGLVRAVQSFDKDSRKNWALHKRRYITAEIYAALGFRNNRFTKTHSLAVSLDVPVNDDDGGDVTFGDSLVDESLPSIDESLLNEEIRRDVRDSIKALPDPKQRQALELHGVEGRDLCEVAGIIGVDLPRAVQIYNRAMSNLSKNHRLLALTDLDERTRFHAHKSVTAFCRDRTSVTEDAALWRIEHRRQ